MRHLHASRPGVHHEGGERSPQDFAGLVADPHKRGFVVAVLIQHDVVRLTEMVAPSYKNEDAFFGVIEKVITQGRRERAVSGTPPLAERIDFIQRDAALEANLPPDRTNSQARKRSQEGLRREPRIKQTIDGRRVSRRKDQTH